MESFTKYIISFLSISRITNLGASGPSTTLNPLSNKPCAKSSAALIFLKLAEGQPETSAAQTTPMVISLLVPGSNTNGPDECMKRLSPA